MKKYSKNINGIERTFHFGLGFLGQLFDETDITFANIDSLLVSNPFKTLPLLMYHSLSYGYLRDGKELDFTIYNINDWVDADENIGVDFIEKFKNSLTKDVPAQEIETDVKKKKRLTGVEM
jgi:hypothetical protein